LVSKHPIQDGILPLICKKIPEGKSPKSSLLRLGWFLWVSSQVCYCDGACTVASNWFKAGPRWWLDLDHCRRIVRMYSVRLFDKYNKDLRTFFEDISIVNAVYKHTFFSIGSAVGSWGY
jgi:hypothetical protein